MVQLTNTRGKSSDVWTYFQEIMTPAIQQTSLWPWRGSWRFYFLPALWKRAGSECFLPLWNVTRSTWTKAPVTSYLFIYFTNLKSGPRLICNLLVLAIFGGEASAAPCEQWKSAGNSCKSSRLTDHYIRQVVWKAKSFLSFSAHLLQRTLQILILVPGLDFPP